MTDPSTQPPETRPRQLWQRALLQLAERGNSTVWHPLDQAAAVRLLQNLYAVGERPTYEEFKRYLSIVWPTSTDVRRRVRTIWRTILQNPHHRFRVKGTLRLDGLHALATRLSREYGEPPLRWRVLEVLDHALERYHDALDDPDLERYLAALREVETTLGTLERLRAAEHGPASIGAWWMMSVEDYTDAEAAEWMRLRKKYLPS